MSNRDFYGNLHVFSNGDGTYSGFIPRKKKVTIHLNTTRTSRQETDNRIETLATKILRTLWENTRNSGAGAPTDPITVIGPAKALEFYGFHLSYKEDLGTHLTDGGIVEVAGVLENDAKSVQVSNKFPPCQDYYYGNSLLNILSLMLFWAPVFVEPNRL